MQKHCAIAKVRSLLSAESLCCTGSYSEVLFVGFITICSMALSKCLLKSLGFIFSCSVHQIPLLLILLSFPPFKIILIQVAIDTACPLLQSMPHKVSIKFAPVSMKANGIAPLSTVEQESFCIRLIFENLRLLTRIEHANISLFD